MTLTFYASAWSDENDQETAAYEQCHDSSGLISVTVAADESHEIPSSVLHGTRFLKIVSNVDDEACKLSFSD